LAIEPAPEQSENFDNNVVAIWSKAVDTQMHFNEMSVKSRQLGLTFVAAALALAVFLFSHSGSDAKYEYHITLPKLSFTLHVAEFIILAAAAAVYAVRLLDLGVYHKMLRGAVAFGEDVEEVHLRRMLQLNKGMTQAVSHFSRHSDASANHREGSATAYTGSNQRTAEKKIARFYTLVIILLIVSALIMFVIGNI
jgi:hypothetical protein